MGSRLERLATMLVLPPDHRPAACSWDFSAVRCARRSIERGIELKEAYRRIEELAELDELTGALNRRCIMRVLEEEIARAHRINAPCSVALIDLDWFKRINDSYGHPTGDEVLRTFAITMFANIRGDRPVRPLRRRGVPAGAARHDANRARSARSTGCARSSPNSTGARSPPGMSVTISAGVQRCCAPTKIPTTLLARADSALYAAKAQGRNRINTA